MVLVTMDYERIYSEAFDELNELNRQMVETKEPQILRGLVLEQKRILERCSEQYFSAHRDVVQLEKEMERKYPKPRHR